MNNNNPSINELLTLIQENNNLNNINITDEEISFNMSFYNNSVDNTFSNNSINTTFDAIIDNLRNISHIINEDISNENNIYFEIEIIQDGNGIDSANIDNTEQKDYFLNRTEINEKLGKSIKIKKNDSIIDENCLICMEVFKERELKRILPKCKHCYHKKCIDKWLIKNSSCPVCRDNLIHNTF